MNTIDSSVNELDAWLQSLIADAQDNREPRWHLRAAKSGMRKKQPELIRYEPKEL